MRGSMDPKERLWTLVRQNRAWFMDQLGWCDAGSDPEEHALLSSILDLTR